MTGILPVIKATLGDARQQIISQIPPPSLPHSLGRASSSSTLWSLCCFSLFIFIFLSLFFFSFVIFFLESFTEILCASLKINVIYLRHSEFKWVFCCRFLDYLFIHFIINFSHKRHLNARLQPDHFYQSFMYSFIYLSIYFLNWPRLLRLYSRSVKNILFLSLSLFQIDSSLPPHRILLTQAPQSQRPRNPPSPPSPTPAVGCSVGSVDPV